MRGFLAVARREIEEKRFVFAAAAAASLLPFAVPLARGLHGQTAREMRDWLALALTSLFAAGLAATLGSTVLAGDLAERRIGFHFSRPISGFALWAGKLGAACLIALAAGAIIYAPTFAANGGRVVLLDLEPGAPASFLVGVIALVSLVNAGSLAMRTRSPWSLFGDAMALLVLALATVAVLRRFDLIFSVGALQAAARILFAAGLTGTILAGLFAVTRGRTDGRAAHRVLSTTLWSILCVGVASTALYGVWILAATPRDLDGVSAALPASRGSWIVVQGEARGFEPVFLLDASSGRSLRAGVAWRWPLVSLDGTRAAWFEPAGKGGPFELVSWKLDDPGAKPVRTQLWFPEMPWATLSEHGERLATIGGGLLSIHDVLSGATLASARLGEGHVYWAGFFASRDRFRAFRSSPIDGTAGRNRLEILELDVATRSLAATGMVDESLFFLVGPSADRLLVREKGGLTLRDGLSGRLLAPLVAQEQARGRFLADGRIVISVVDGGALRLEVFGSDGRHQRTIPIPARDRIALGGEIAAGRLVVAAGGSEKERESRTIFLADASSGAIQEVANRLFPVAYYAPFLSNRKDQPEPGSEATKLFYGPGRSLVHFDPLTGERRTILAGKGGR